MPAIRLTLLMTLMPDADYAEVMAALLGDLPLVPWQRPYQVPTATLACTWREALGPRAGAAPGQGAGRDRRRAPGTRLACALAGAREVCSIDGSLIRDLADSLWLKFLWAAGAIPVTIVRASNRPGEGCHECRRRQPGPGGHGGGGEPSREHDAAPPTAGSEASDELMALTRTSCTRSISLVR
jgi:hypothetical protein